MLRAGSRSSPTKNRHVILQRQAQRFNTDEITSSVVSASHNMECSTHFMSHKLHYSWQNCFQNGNTIYITIIIPPPPGGVQTSCVFSFQQHNFKTENSWTFHDYLHKELMKSKTHTYKGQPNVQKYKDTSVWMFKYSRDLPLTTEHHWQAKILTEKIFFFWRKNLI
jgi:hypothetical protein